MNEFIKKEVKNIEISGIRRFNHEANKVKDVLKLTIGELDFHTPEKQKQNAINAIQNNKTRYTENKGILELRKEIVTKYTNYIPDEVILTVGTTEALALVIKSVINENDEVIIKAPGYVGYKPLIHLEKGRVVLVQDFSNTSLQKAISPRTKMILTTSPNNPTGEMLSVSEMNAIKDAVLNHNLLLVSDEIYSDICFKEFHSFSSYTALKKHLVLLNGFSKSHAMTGFRIGYLLSDISLINELIKVHQYTVTSASTISQYAALGATGNPSNEMIKSLSKRRDIVLNTLDEIGLSYFKPDGAFYVFFDISPFHVDSETFCLNFLKEYKVALIPGQYFLGDYKQHVRLSYAVDEKTLKEALNRLKTFYISKK